MITTNIRKVVIPGRKTEMWLTKTRRRLSMVLAIFYFDLKRCYKDILYDYSLNWISAGILHKCHIFFVRSTHIYFTYFVVIINALFKLISICCQYIEMHLNVIPWTYKQQTAKFSYSFYWFISIFFGIFLKSQSYHLQIMTTF